MRRRRRRKWAEESCTVAVPSLLRFALVMATTIRVFIVVFLRTPI